MNTIEGKSYFDTYHFMKILFKDGMSMDILKWQLISALEIANWNIESSIWWKRETTEFQFQHQ